MLDAKLDLTVQSFTANELAIKVKNSGTVSLVKPLQMEITLPRMLPSQHIRKAAEEAPKKNPPLANVDAQVKGTEGKFSVWVEPETSDHFLTIRFFNDLDKDCAEISPMILTAGAEFTILIPLDPDTHHISINLPYGYEYQGEPRVDGKLELKVEETGWTPDVTLWTDKASPTAIEPRTDVIINWKIENGVSAVLRGPLPGGNTEWSLSDSPTSKFKMSQGSFLIKAVASVTYMLQAEVKDPSGKRPNMEVARMLTLDISTAGKQGYLAVRPARVLPYGLVELDWAAWGVKAIRITTPGAFREFQLTDMTLSGFAQGSGVVRTIARKTSDAKTPADLYIELQGTMQKACDTAYEVVPWTKIEGKPFTGRPLGLAIAAATVAPPAAPKMGLLTTDGLWIAEVGEYDSFDTVDELKFTKANTDRPRAWLAIAALGNKFVVLRQTDQSLQVALYKSNGTLDEIPPLDLKPVMGSDPVFDFTVYRNRVYVVVESSRAGRVRSAFSVGFDSTTKKAEFLNEFLLESLHGYRLVTFDNALFALNRDSGRMLRLELKDGKLEPYKAASAVDETGASMVKQGLLVPAGRVLAVLSPTAVPSLASLASFGLKNVLPYTNLTPPQDTSRSPQDLVYSPLNDRWSRCGHGLDIKEGVVAFRGGPSPRLWVIDPNGETHTLTGASEDLFLPDYVKDLPSKPLPPVLNKKREFMFINNSGMQFVPLNETCFRAGLWPFSASSLVQLSTPLPKGSDPRKPEPILFRYNEAESPSKTILRFLAKRGPGVKHEYVLEVTLNGPNFSWGTTAFKRITLDGGSAVDMPDKVDFPTTLGLIETFPKQLSNGIRLQIRNRTPYTLWLRSPDATDPTDQLKKYDPQGTITIKYNTPPFSIYAHGVGEFPVDVDFTLRDGIEMSMNGEVQQERIRVRWNVPQAFAMEYVSVNKTIDYDVYEFTLRYNVDRTVNGTYMGDGVPSKDGASIYLPVADPPNVTNAKIVKIDANRLVTLATAPVPGRNIFTCPNSVAVLSDTVVAILNREHISVFDHALKPKPGLPLHVFDFNIITNLKGSPNNSIFYLLGMKEQPTWQIKKSYRYDGWSLSPLRQHFYRIVDFFKGYRPGRVPEAPPWVAPNTISPMDIRPGAAVAICVEGGIIGDNLTNDTEIAVELPGTGREEAVLVDPTEMIIFCAHSKPGGQALMISRINVANPGDKRTIELPRTVTHMVTDPTPVGGPNLEYYRPRAVSLLATPDALFVSHGRRLYVLDKTRLTQRESVELRLPARLIQVRRGKPPGESDPTYGVPQDCYLVWAIGARYVGDGQVVRAEDYGKAYETAIFKIAVLP